MQEEKEKQGREKAAEIKIEFEERKGERRKVRNKSKNELR